MHLHVAHVNAALYGTKKYYMNSINVIKLMQSDYAQIYKVDCEYYILVNSIQYWVNPNSVAPSMTRLECNGQTMQKRTS